MSNETFASVWDAIEDTAAQAENMKLRSTLMMALESSSARAEQMARHIMIHGRLLTLSEIVAKIEAVTVESTQPAMF